MLVNVKDVKLGVIGCGKMASAIFGGVYRNNFIPSENIFVYDKNLEASASICSKYNFNEVYSISELVKNVDVIFLAVKPYNFREVLLEVKQSYTDQLILSILAGVKLEKYNQIIQDAPVVRVMPNTPALVNLGMSALVKNNLVDEFWLEFSQKLMSNCGEVILTDESKMDIITALSGSGPAFYFRIIDLMAKSAVKLGLNKKEALLLSTQTALGSAKMILENEFDVEKLITNVTTPGGCTEVGNKLLNNSDLEDILDNTIKETMQKAQELG